MLNVILAGLLLILALLGVIVRKTYYAVPQAELKRRAGRRQSPASQFYRAVAYGGTLRSFLWLYIGFASAGSIILLARLLPVWVSLLIVGPLLWLAFSWLPVSRVSTVSQRFTLWVTPAITWLLNLLHPLLGPGAKAVEQRYLPFKHTGLFEREDLVRLIERQQIQPDNHFSDEELEIVKHALSFSDYKVADIMTPAAQIKTVLADDTLGPVLIDELHKTGQSRIPVKDKPKGDFVGLLLVSKLGITTSGLVSQVMEPTTYYLHENDSLREALHAFFVTNHPLFIVVNNNQRYVGTVTIDDVMRKLLGHVPGAEFDHYADPQAVVARHQQKPDKLDSDETEAEIEVIDED